MDNKSQISDPRIVEKVNQIYHDLQSSFFNELHSRRHSVERIFWQDMAMPLILRNNCLKIIDLCSGTGFVPSVLLPFVPGNYTIECLDLSPKALQTTRARFENKNYNISFCVGSAETLPFPDQTIDCITINAGLHHVPNWQLCLQEIDRVLKDGGLFCLGHEPNDAFFSNKLITKIERIIWHLGWYLSISQNKRRISKLFKGATQTDYQQAENIEKINKILLEDKIISKPLTTDELRKLVDPHTHSNDDEHGKIGFSPDKLIESYFSHYTCQTLYFSDYGGDMLRNFPTLRKFFDSLMGCLFKKRGRLFSWVLQKRHVTSTTL